MFLEKTHNFAMPQIGYYNIMQCHVEKLGHLEITIHDLQTYSEQKNQKTCNE